MTLYFKKGDEFHPTAESAIDLHQQLPVGSYIIKKNHDGEFYFVEADRFTLDFKLYGNTTKDTDRILNTFNSRPSTTGVMLTGEKGSGKSLLAKNVSIKAAELGYPTLIINEPLYGDSFNKLIQDIQQPCVILLDEFEKVYDKDEQQAVLTLLDGVFPSKKLFMITCNDVWRVDSHMRNRPGRIYYMLHFSGVDNDFIKEYCIDNLNNTSYIDEIIKLSSLFAEFNFDMLKALVAEMNIYNESPKESLRMLNIDPTMDKGVESFKIDVTFEDNTDPVLLYRNTVQGNPLLNDFDIDYRYNDDDEWTEIELKTSKIKHINSLAGQYVYADPSTNSTIVLTKVVTPKFDFYNAF